MDTIDPQLMEILVCPKCHSRLKAVESELACESDTCRLIYPIRDGIPIMLEDQARVLTANDKLDHKNKRRMHDPSTSTAV